MKAIIRFLNSDTTTKETSLNWALLILRIGLTYPMIVLHGWPKLQGLFAGNSEFPDPLGVGNQLSLILAVFAEVLCSVLMALGLKMRWALIPLIFTMIVAAWVVNGDKAFIYQEKAFVYLVGYVVLFMTGAGKLSLSATLKRK